MVVSAIEERLRASLVSGVKYACEKADTLKVIGWERSLLEAARMAVEGSFQDNKTDDTYRERINGLRSFTLSHLRNPRQHWSRPRFDTAPSLVAAIDGVLTTAFFMIGEHADDYAEAHFTPSIDRALSYLHGQLEVWPERPGNRR